MSSKDDKANRARAKQEFLRGGDVKTSNKLYCHQNFKFEDNVRQVSYRLPEKDLLWLKETVNGNINFVVAHMIRKQIKDLKRRLGRGEVEITGLD